MSDPTVSRLEPSLQAIAAVNHPLRRRLVDLLNL